jgi:hypothetical protein
MRTSIPFLPPSVGSLGYFTATKMIGWKDLGMMDEPSRSCLRRLLRE